MRKIGLILGMLLLFVGCSQVSEPQAQETPNQETETVDSDALDTSNLNILDASTMFSDDDKDTSFDATTALSLDVGSLTNASSVNGVTISDDFITIQQAGTYVLSGTTTRSVKVDVSESEKVHLVFNGVTINANNFAALYIYEADEVKLTIASNSVNTLTNTGGFSEDGDVNVDAVIFSRQDLILNGDGSLSVNATDGNGITGKDDLKLYGTLVNVTATNHGIEANDSVRIGSSTVVVNAGRDAIQADNTEDVTKGYVYVETSNLSLNAGNDGIQASSVLQIQSGDFKIVTFNGVDSSVDESLDESYKGLKADGIVFLGNGTYDINTADDAIHSGMDVIIDAGTYSIKTLDDGIHADETIQLNRPVITILESYEGLEAKVVEIDGGTISISASDDGINASDGTTTSGAPGQMGNANSDLLIQINGGLVSVNAGGDGIDSNGNIEVTGGEVYISTDGSGGDVGVDYDGTASITGGIIVSTGSQGMAQNFTTATQGSILYGASSTIAQGSQIKVSDQEGNGLIDTVAAGDFNSILISSPDFAQNDTLTLSLGSNETTITLTTLITSSGNGNQGGRPGGRR
ncbi:hypothetical protein AOC36_03240 [Erysipelothrix larvae]|uniref:Dockerin type 1 n=1 Tax=Erysipelothrix larvae TaxID=1514105 RepID=A0A120JTJ4_9FIRM|nr:carbohydrate-binding domain-containing protein [Erysipelothrix larvae]AMC93030.1 hypothetical protein AOC36_03240 [Erysipelothrix larvae]